MSPRSAISARAIAVPTTWSRSSTSSLSRVAFSPSLIPLPADPGRSSFENSPLPMDFPPFLSADFLGRSAGLNGRALALAAACSSASSACRTLSCFLRSVIMLRGIHQLIASDPASAPTEASSPLPRPRGPRTGGSTKASAMAAACPRRLSATACARSSAVAVAAAIRTRWPTARNFPAPALAGSGSSPAETRLRGDGSEGRRAVAASTFSMFTAVESRWDGRCTTGFSDTRSKGTGVRGAHVPTGGYAYG
mmetsp:Transcript_29740/g.95615  ORF Transcript_29740/g.95615 Transcript_29740/m.95615 type:complete len:251 (+) Transcript_29740:1972-2724(+)